MKKLFLLSVLLLSVNLYSQSSLKDSFITNLSNLSLDDVSENGKKFFNHDFTYFLQKLNVEKDKADVWLSQKEDHLDHEIKNMVLPYTKIENIDKMLQKLSKTPDDTTKFIIPYNQITKVDSIINRMVIDDMFNLNTNETKVAFKSFFNNITE